MNFRSRLIPCKEKIEFLDNQVPGLLAKLSEKQTSLDDSFLNIQKEWQQKRVCYLRTKLKLDLLLTVLEEFQLTKHYQNLTYKEQQKLTEMNHTLRSSRIDKSDGLLRNVPQNQKIDEKIAEKIKVEMKMKMLATCSELLLHYYSNKEVKGNSIRNAGSLYKNALELVNLIKNDLYCITNATEYKISKFEESNEINTEKQKKQRLKDHLHVLNQIVETHLINSVPKNNDTNVDHLAAKV